MRFETCFLLLEASQFHCHASMELEDAKYGMRSPELSIRFPYGQHFYQGATRLLGLGRALGRQSLMLSIPAVLEDGEYRRAYRVTGWAGCRSPSAPGSTSCCPGTLVNLSTSGVLHAFQPGTTRRVNCWWATPSIWRSVSTTASGSTPG